MLPTGGALGDDQVPQIATASLIRPSSGSVLSIFTQIFQLCVGVVTTDSAGKATVELPDWFETLNRDFRYQLTPIGGGAPELHISKKVAHGSFSIADARPDQEISWQITGIRQDAWANENRIPVEEAKPKAERGTYLYPQGFGKPESAGLGAEVRGKAS